MSGRAGFSLPEALIALTISAVLVMLVASGPIMRFIHAHPTVKILALAFVLLIGMALVADGMGFHIPKGYLYFAMLFSVFVEGVNVTIARRRRAHRQPAATHGDERGVAARHHGLQPAHAHSGQRRGGDD